MAYCAVVSPRAKVLVFCNTRRENGSELILARGAQEFYGVYYAQGLGGECRRFPENSCGCIVVKWDVELIELRKVNMAGTGVLDEKGLIALI